MAAKRWCEGQAVVSYGRRPAVGHAGKGGVRRTGGGGDGRTGGGPRRPRMWGAMSAAQLGALSGARVGAAVQSSEWGGGMGWPSAAQGRAAAAGGCGGLNRRLSATVARRGPRGGGAGRPQLRRAGSVRQRYGPMLDTRCACFEHVTKTSEHASIKWLRVQEAGARHTHR